MVDVYTWLIVGGIMLLFLAVLAVTLSNGKEIISSGAIGLYGILLIMYGYQFHEEWALGFVSALAAGLICLKIKPESQNGIVGSIIFVIISLLHAFILDFLNII